MRQIEDYRISPAGNWRTYRYDMDKGHDIARYIARNPYAFPGGYSLFAITDDGGVLCSDCCKNEYYMIRTARKGDGWNVEGYSSTEIDDEIYCDHCGENID